MPILRTILLIPLISVLSLAQIHDDEWDKCGIADPLAKSTLQILGDHWGYGYDSLLVDLEKWAASPYIQIDSIGHSVQDRAIWRLTISSAEPVKSAKQTVAIHARTHPGEVQSFWVTEQIISQLSAESEFAALLRRNTVFYIVPMYNPDGVELEYDRENAHGIDLERNWDTTPPEPEVATLKTFYGELMASEAPIRIMLNMHSAYGQHRYFVCHAAAGTSADYLALEQEFIEGVRSYFPGGIEPWNFNVTWTGGTPSYYPESWFWLNYGASVMALTYEDWNDAAAGDYDLTANALLHGIADYLDISATGLQSEFAVADRLRLYPNYPNPFNPATTLRYELALDTHVQLKVYDLAGRMVRSLVNEFQPAGNYQYRFDARDLPSGVYVAELRTRQGSIRQKMILLK